MHKVLFALLILISGPSAYSDELCFDLKKGKAITRELQAMVDDTLCSRALSADDVRWGIKTILPQVMSKSFLGVEPPANWRLLVEDLQQSCLDNHRDFCQDKTQREVEDCVATKVPALIMFWAPWFAEHCAAINKTVILNWQEKKPLIRKWITEWKQQRH